MGLVDARRSKNTKAIYESVLKRKTTAIGGRARDQSGNSHIPSPTMINLVEVGGHRGAVLRIGVPEVFPKAIG
jgi:hypothetical protein